ncbi:unnamed protein product [Peronospora belbahrii]|uniref:Nitroreductase domain-containing protein n=1 Tax=Peronospora belbahrii TaxID=622444 RepID=A0ABN8D728_9STRA|nr:unnamed protein product [Peronospora belbahrii]
MVGCQCVTAQTSQWRIALKTQSNVAVDSSVPILTIQNVLICFLFRSSTIKCLPPSSPRLLLLCLASATSIGLAFYALKLRAKIASIALDKKTTTNVIKTTKILRDSHDNRLWNAEELLAQRRSIFSPNFDIERRVSREVLTKMLEGANWAPTHGRTEPWRFVVFEAPDKRLELNQLMAKGYKNTVPPNEFIET